jgi:sulfonate transport system substrate-binding protein
MSKKTVAVVVVIIIILVAILGLYYSGFLRESDEEGKIKYGGQYYPEEFVLKGAASKGDAFWDEYDIDVEHILFQSANEGNQALISGEIDVVIGSDSKTVSLFSAIPDDAVIIGTSQKGDRYSTVIPVDSTVTSWQEMKGKKVGIKLGTGAEQVVRRLFDADANLSWDDFEWVNMDVSNMAAALQTGQVVSFTAWEPTPGIAEAQGIGKIMMTYGHIAPVPVCLTTTKDFIKDHRDELVNFLAAHMDKAELIENNPNEAAKLAVQAATDLGSDISEDAFLKIFNRIDFDIEFDESVIDSIKDTAQFLKDQGKIDTVPELRYDLTILEDAKELRK